MSNRPVNHLIAAGKQYPKAWQQVEMFRSSKGKDLPDWPNWCFLPFAAWYAIVSEGGNMPINRVPDVGRLAAIGTWRYSQGIYRFDTDIYKAVSETVQSGDIPVEVLFRLPEWSVYIETPGREWLGSPLHGFWAHLEFDIEKKSPELRLVLDTEKALYPMPLHIGNWTITEAVDRAMSEVKKQANFLGFALPVAEPDKIAEPLYGLVSLVLYLCSDEPDIDDKLVPGTTPERAKPTRVKGGWRLFPAAKPRYWSVGHQLGDRLRKEGINQVEGERSVTPHLRRAHWHGFWTGPRDGERHFHYKFLPPTVVRGK